MDTSAIPIIVLVCLFLGNVLFGCIPSVISRLIGFYSSSEDEWSRKLKWTTFLLYIGAGVFISNSFIVLLPQANSEFENHENHSHEGTGASLLQSSPKEQPGHHHDSFPMPEFTVLCGFFVAFVMQEAIYLLLSKFNQTSREDSIQQVRFCSCAKRHTECSRTFKDIRPDQTLFGLEKKLMESRNVPSSEGAGSNVLPEPDVTPKSELLRSSIIAQAVPNYGAVTNVTEPVIDNPLPVLTPSVLLPDERRLLMEQYAETTDPNKFLISSMLIVIELSLQYIFLGIHLGLRTGQFRRWSYLTVACLQNFLLNFSAGSYLAVGNLEFSYAGLFIGLLSTVSPIGMIAAMIEKNAVEEIPHLAKGIVSAVACGALLYTTFHELLRQKASGSVTGLTKLFAIALGASVMTVVQYGILTV